MCYELERLGHDVVFHIDSAIRPTRKDTAGGLHLGLFSFTPKGAWWGEPVLCGLAVQYGTALSGATQVMSPNQGHGLRKRHSRFNRIEEEN